MAANPSRLRIPRSVWALGLVSLAMDSSSEIIHALMPLFLTTTLGASVVVVGVIDGFAESAASITKIFSGYLSDRIGRRKPLILLGYGLAALSKPLFPLATVPAAVLGARFVDRIGKGIRGAPRDALVADLTPAEIRGRAYGLRQALDTVGAVLGPLAAVALMFLFADDMRSVFWVAVVPAAVAVLLVALGVEERAGAEQRASPPIRWRDAGQLGSTFWGVVIIGVVFTLARFSEAFLILKASAEGLPLAWAPLVLVVMNVVYALGAYPAGALADRFGVSGLLQAGLGALIGADLLLALCAGLGPTFVGIALWGVHLALTQGLFSKLVAENAPPTLRGSAFGIFHLLTGVALLCASGLAGLLWDVWGSSATFLGGALFSGSAMLGYFLWRQFAAAQRDVSSPP